MKEWYIYIDESGDPNPQIVEGSEAIFSAGMLLTTSEVVQSQINEALGKLKNDSDFDDDLDTNTLDRGYFHASFDSKNAHSYICRVASSVNPALLEVFRFDRTSEGYRQRSDETARTRHVNFVNLLICRSSTSRIDKVNVFIAERQQTFHKTSRKVTEKSF